MTVLIAPNPIFQAFGTGGAPLAFGQLFTYQAGTTTPLATWTDSTQTQQNTNPVVLNALGQAAVWTDISKVYKFLLQDALGNQLYVLDNIPGSGFISSLTGGSYGTDSGTANAYIYTHTASSSPALLTAGTLIRFTPLNTNTGTSTLNADGTGAVAVIRANGSALTGGELSSLGPVVLQSTGTQWQIVSTAGAQPGFERTTAEIAKNIIPSNYAGYRPGHLLRFVAAGYSFGANAATDTAALLAMYNSCITGALLGGVGSYKGFIPSCKASPVTNITQAVNAVFTVNTISTVNPFIVNENVTVSDISTGMTQVNTLSGQVTATGGVSGAWTITTNIDTHLFAAYTAGGTLLGVYLIQEGVLKLDNARTTLPFPIIETETYTTVIYLGSGFADDALLTLRNGAAGSFPQYPTTDNFYWYGGFHGGFTARTLRTSGVAGHALSLTGLWGTRFGPILANNLKGSLLFLPQAQAAGSDPDPGAISFSYFELLDAYNCYFTIDNENSVGLDSTYFKATRGTLNTQGVVKAGGDACFFEQLDASLGFGWAYDEQNTGANRNYIWRMECDNMQYGLRVGKSFECNYLGLRFNHRYQFNPNLTANYWPRICISLGALAAPNVRSTRVQAVHRISPGLVTASISGITVAATAVVTVNTVSGSNPFAVGNSITCTAVSGMTQINGVPGKVTAIGGSSGAWTVTTTINSNAFSAYTSGGTLSNGSKADLGVFCDLNLSGAFTSDVTVEQGIFDNAGYTYFDTDIYQNTSIGNYVGLFQDGRRIYDARIAPRIIYTGSAAATSIPNSGFISNTIAFPTKQWDPTSTALNASQIWDPTNFAFIAPYDGLARFNANFVLNVAAGTHIRMAIAEFTYAGIATLNAPTGGSGYTNGTYTHGASGVSFPLILRGGSGVGATAASVTVSGGAVTSITLGNAGNGYLVNDVLWISMEDIGGTGAGFQVTVATLAALASTGTFLDRSYYQPTANNQSYQVDGLAQVTRGRRYALSADQNTAGAVAVSIPIGNLSDCYFHAEMCSLP